MSRSIHIAARALIETVCRDGGLAQLSFHNLSPQAGTRTHRSFYRQLESSFSDFEAKSEQSLGLIVRDGDLTIEIQGRADLLLLPTSAKDAESSAFFPSAASRSSFSQADREEKRTENRDPATLRPQIRELRKILRHPVDLLEEKHPVRAPILLEIKTVGLPLEELQKEGYDLHWAQALLYTALFRLGELLRRHAVASSSGEASKTGSPAAPLEARPSFHELEELLREEANTLSDCALAYVSQEDLSCRILRRKVGTGELLSFLRACIRAYLRFASDLSIYQEERNRSIRALSFPHPSLRAGQKMFMEEVLSGIKNRSALLAELPTGTGKTLAALYPAIKALGFGLTKGHIFYLTAKASTRMVAEKALRQLRQNGLFLRSITLRAKEQVCLEPDLFCDHNLCPYATHYYEHLSGALIALLPIQDLSAEKIADVAREKKLCPFELALDLSLFADVVIGDYNHALDPRVRLERFFNQSSEHHTLLFDEAHNLSDRSRDMYSTDLRSQNLDEARAKLPPAARGFAESLDALRRYLDLFRLKNMSSLLSDFLRSQESALEEEAMTEFPGFFAMRAQSVALNELIRQCLKQSRGLFEYEAEPEARRCLRQLLADLRFFLRIADEFWSERYVFAFRCNERSYHLRLICLDPAEWIEKSYAPHHAAVFFSATLSPYSYYSKMVSAKGEGLRKLSLSSPFPQENRRVFVLSSVSTTYREREQSAERCARAVAFAAVRVGGHQLAFFPSFAYLKLVAKELKPYLPPSVRLIEQSPQMTQAARDAFIGEFMRLDEKRPHLLGLAVLGGIFSEGIDLVGPRLDGVSIIGVGLPQLSPERNMMSEYYEQRFGDGFFYAYQFPGFNKVLQAAGRLIRSAEDMGFILLIDRRYEEERYRSLLPSDWHPSFFHEESELVAALDDMRAFIDEGRAYMREMGIPLLPAAEETSEEGMEESAAAEGDGKEPSPAVLP